MIGRVDDLCRGPKVAFDDGDSYTVHRKDMPNTFSESSSS